MLKPNKIISVRGLEALLRWWPFFKQGLDALRKEAGFEKEATEYFKVLLHVASLDKSKGLILVLVSGSGQPYGYLVAVDNTIRFSPRSLNIYAVYSNNQCPSTILELASDVRTWAKDNGYQEVQACSSRFSGASIRWFQKKMGFTGRFIVFHRKL